LGLAESDADVRKSLLDARRESGHDLRTVFSAIDQLEVDIGRVLLKVHSLVEILQEKGVVTRDELTAKARTLDELDGHADGVLHPMVFRTEEEKNASLSARAFLVELEKENIPSPKEFLAQLERQDAHRETATE
jgi:hypothetical protein